MAISIVVSDIVRFKVAGLINDEHGVPQPFDFKLTAQRIKDIEVVQSHWRVLLANTENATQVADALLPYMKGWSGVKDEGGQDLPFTEESFRALMRLPGLALLTNSAFLRECGAKEKN